MKGRRLIAGVAAGTVTLTLFAGTAQAAPSGSLAGADSPSRVASDAGLSGVSNQEMDRLAANVEVLFTEVLVKQDDGTYRLDEQSATAAFGPQKGQRIIQEFRSVAQQQNAAGASTPPQQPGAGSGQVVLQQQSYGECVLAYSGYGAVFGIFNGTLVGYIDAKNWDASARLIAKAVGKSAIRGGVVGLAASLAASATWCATPWA